MCAVDQKVVTTISEPHHTYMRKSVTCYVQIHNNNNYKLCSTRFTILVTFLNECTCGAQPLLQVLSMLQLTRQSYQVLVMLESVYEMK